MYVLNYWHTVTDYGQWKQIFDADPLGREASGVRRVVIERPVGQENRVVGHLEFASQAEAEAFAGKLQEIWSGSASATVSDTGYTVSEILVDQRLGREAGHRAA